MKKLLALIKKEFYQIVRDPSSILIAFILPCILLPIYRYGLNLDTTKLTLGIKNEDKSLESESLVDSINKNKYIKTQEYKNRSELYKAINNGRIQGIIIIPSDFTQKLSQSKTAALQIITDGTETNTANYIENYLNSISKNWLFQLSKYRFSQPTPLIETESRMWYNQETNSHYFILPGTLSITLTLIGMLLTALVICREWERGTMELLITTHISKTEFILSKYISYFILGFASAVFNVMVCIYLFDIPFRGSYPILLISTSVFLFTSLGLGLLISSYFKNQFTASQAALVGGFMPSLILSGLVFPIQSMPQTIQYITYLIPARYYLPCIQSEFLAGTIKNIIITNILALLFFGIILMYLVYKQTNMRLEKC